MLQYQARPKRTRVVITGMGAITPLGHTPDDLWCGLLAGRSGIGPVTLFDATNYKTRIAGEVKGFDPTKYVEAKDARRMGRATLFALGAARDALNDAGIKGNFDDIGAGGRGGGGDGHEQKGAGQGQLVRREKPQNLAGYFGVKAFLGEIFGWDGWNNGH